jgi:hypothetical protein
LTGWFQLHLKCNGIEAASDTVVQSLVINLESSARLLTEMELEKERMGIKAREYSEWKVSFQEIVKDVVKDVRDHGEDLDQKVFKATITHMKTTV